jgi:hypothetical protein
VQRKCLLRGNKKEKEKNEKERKLFSFFFASTEKLSPCPFAFFVFIPFQLIKSSER